MTKSTFETLGLFALSSLIIFTGVFVFSRLGINTKFLVLVGNGLLLIVVISIAKIYSERLSKTWQIIFYIVSIFAIFEYVWSII